MHTAWMMRSTVVMLTTIEVTMLMTTEATMLLITDLFLLCNDCLLQCLPIDLLTAPLDKRWMGLAPSLVPLGH